MEFNMLTTSTFFRKPNILGALAVSAMGFMLPLVARAAEDALNWRPSVLNVNVGNVLLAFFNIFWPIVVTIIIIMILYSGFLFLSAQGDPTKAAEARKVLLWAIVGIIIIVLSGTMIAFISNLFSPAPQANANCGQSSPQCNGTCPAGQTCSINGAGEGGDVLSICICK
ncbi:hypothetical protein KW786_01510 [Candidatus Parcubacteria bacterium]|nr:hypothetical protein [Candidatus Parcubacteria bacterium]